MSLDVLLRIVVMTGKAKQQILFHCQIREKKLFELRELLSPMAAACCKMLYDFRFSLI